MRIHKAIRNAEAEQQALHICHRLSDGWRNGHAAVVRKALSKVMQLGFATGGGRGLAPR